MRQPSSLNILRAAHGFTLVEAMIAVAVLLLGVLTLEKNFTAQIMNNNSTKLVSGGVASSSSFLEWLQTLPLNDPLLADTNNNGCGLDNINLNDTIDQDGRVLADHAANWPEGEDKNISFFDNTNKRDLDPQRLFTVFWNVCDNPNVAGTRQIRVLIRWRDNNRANNVVDNDRHNNQQVVMNYVRGNL